MLVKTTVSICYLADKWLHATGTSENSREWC